MKQNYFNVYHKNEIQIKSTPRGTHIYIKNSNQKYNIERNKIRIILLELFVMLKKFKFYHLKTPKNSINYFLATVKTSLKSPTTFKNIGIPALCYEEGWDSRKITFTVAVTVHNQSQSELNRCIKSILGQSRLPDFVEILDDGSSKQETLKALKKVATANPKIIVLRSKNNGVIRARNFLINRCKTSHLLFVDPDDELVPQYLEEAEKLFQSDRSIEVVYPNVLVRNNKNEKLWITGPFDAKILKFVNTIPMSSVCATEVFKDLEGFSEEFNRGYEDWDFWVRASLSGVRAAPLKSVGYFYSEKTQSRSRNAEEFKEDLTRLIQDRDIGKRTALKYYGQVKIFIFAPWFIQGGGVDMLIERLIKQFTHHKVALVTTEIKPKNYSSAITSELENSIPIIERIKFSSDVDFMRILEKLASKKAFIINMSSPWAFNNSLQLSSFITHHFAWAFNEIGASRIANCSGSITEAWPVYAGLSTKLQSITNKRIPTEVIYVGIQQKRKENRRKISSRKLKVGWIGRLSPEKDPIKFIKIANSSDGSKFLFSMAGDGPLRTKVLLKIKQGKNLNYLGFVESSNNYLRDLDVLVLTSKIEGIPLVAMEALQLGVYVVAPRVGGLSDLIKDKKNGLLYDGSKNDLLRALREARTIILSKKSSPTLHNIFLEKTMFAHINSRILHYQRLSKKRYL
jgi:glycosyltransferase involved in cell wall biosynthesis